MPLKDGVEQIMLVPYRYPLPYSPRLSDSQNCTGIYLLSGNLGETDELILIVLSRWVLTLIV